MSEEEGGNVEFPLPPVLQGSRSSDRRLPVGVLLENLRADVVSLDKVLTKGTRQNDKEHEELFERVWFWKTSPANPWPHWWPKGGARVKREGDQAM